MVSIQNQKCTTVFDDNTTGKAKCIYNELLFYVSQFGSSQAMLIKIVSTVYKFKNRVNPFIRGFIRVNSLTIKVEIP